MKKLIFALLFFVVSVTIPAQTIGFGMKSTPIVSNGQTEIVRSADISLLLGQHLILSASDGSDISSIGVGYRVNFTHSYIGPTADYVLFNNKHTIELGCVIGLITDYGFGFQAKVTKNTNSISILLTI